MHSILVYIHGFHSSPLSLKAQQMADWCQKNRPDISVIIPQLAYYPEAAAMQLLTVLSPYLVGAGKDIGTVKTGYRIGFVGSSLGGYLATWLNAQYGSKAVVINPAVRPYELLQDYLGDQVHPYTQETYTLSPEHMAELKKLEVEHISDPSSLWVLLQDGDEVLDFSQAVKKYQGCKQTIESGGDHAFIGFERYLPQIIKFLDL